MATLQSRIADLITAIGTDMKLKADKLNVVDLLSTQTVAGIKTFSQPPLSFPIPTLNSNAQLTHKKYVDDLFASIPAGSGGTQAPANYIPVADRDLVNIGFSRRQKYVIPKEDLLNYGDGASDATKIAAYTNNNLKYKTARANYPNRIIEFDRSTGERWPISVFVDEFDTANYPQGVADRIIGDFKQVAGTFPDQATYDAYVANGSNPGNYIPAKPCISITRLWGVPQSLGTLSIATFGPGSPVPWYMQTQQATKAPLVSNGNVITWKQGDAAVIGSNDSYDYAVRAGYSGNNVWKTQRVNVADLAMDVANYTLAAASSANVTAGGPALVPNGGSSANGMEARMIKGGTSLTTALVRGDTGASQLLFKEMSNNFTIGEDIIDVQTNTKIGTVSALYLVFSGKLNATYTTNPWIRKMRKDLPVMIEGSFELDTNTDAFIPKWNRCPEIALTGTYDHAVDVNLISGSQRGLTITSCFKGVMKVKGGGLPNSAIETLPTKEEAYGYGAVVLGCSADLDFVLDLQNVRHGFSSNVLGGRYNLNSSGSTGTDAQSLNYHKYGTSRDIRVTGSVFYTFGACIDTHEGMEGLVIYNFRLGKSFWGGRNLSAGMGINTRGFNTIIRDGYIEEVKVGIFDSSQSTPVAESNFRSDTYIKNVIVRKAQQAGYSTNDDVYTGQLITSARTYIDGCEFEGDLDIPTSIYSQSGIIMNRGWIMTRDVTIRKQNSAMITHRGSSSSETPPSNGGVGIHVDPIFDFTEGNANTCIRYETNMTTAAVLDQTILAQANLRPAYIFRHENDTPTTGITPTNVQFSGINIVQMGTTTVVPQLSYTKAANTRPGTTTYLADPGAPTGSGASLPTGGTTGQVLAKKSATDGDVQWVTPSAGSGGGTQVSVDGVNVSTFDVSSVPPFKILTLDADTANIATGANVTDISALQTSLTPGEYVFEAELDYQVGSGTTGAPRLGFGGAGISGMTLRKGASRQWTSLTAANNAYLNAMVTAGSAGVTTVGSANVAGLTPGVFASSLPWQLTARVLVTTTGVVGLIGHTSNGADRYLTLRAGSYLKITKVP